MFQQSGTRNEWLKVDAASGQTSPLFDAGRMETALASLPGVTRTEAGLVARSSELTFNPARTGALVTIADDLYFYDIADRESFTSHHGIRDRRGSDRSVRTGTSSPSCARTISTPSTSPTQKERALTSDGSREILNGKLDWLYQEEIYGRDRFRGYWWSPDSARVAFLQLDERPVPEYTVVDHIPYRPSLEVTDYPKAGDPNPAVKLGVAKVSGGAPVVDRSRRRTRPRILSSSTWTGRRTPGTSSIRSRTASRPGSI